LAQNVREGTASCEATAAASDAGPDVVGLEASGLAADRVSSDAPDAFVPIGSLAEGDAVRPVPELAPVDEAGTAVSSLMATP
jgi:hypothetical protein